MSPSTTQRGQQAEALAVQYLEQEGYQIVELNFRIRGGEIDIIAEERGVLCLVEVRSRRSTEYGHPLETINHKKRKRLLLAANHLLLKRGWSEKEIRFDVVAIVYQPVLEIVLVRGAFDASS
jgi:putative endonuclease